MAQIRHIENRHDVIFFCRRWSDLDKISQTNAEWHVDCGDVVEIKSRCRTPIWRTFGRIQWHVITSSHISHCRVLPRGKFTVIIPEPHAILQGAVTWRNQCHDRATLQGVRIPSAILKNVFRHIFFLFLMQFRLWRAAAFVSSPIHLFIARQHSDARYWYSKSVCLPVRHTPVLCLNGYKYPHNSFNIG